MKRRHVRLDHDRPLNQRRPPRVIPPLVRQHPQQMQRHRMVGILLKNAPVNPLRLRQLPSGMLPQRQVQRLRRGEHAHTQKIGPPPSQVNRMYVLSPSPGTPGEGRGEGPPLFSAYARLPRAEPNCPTTVDAVLC